MGRSEQERQGAAIALVSYAGLLTALVVIELAMVVARPTPLTLAGDFIQKASLSYVMSLFLGYLVIGALGFGGTLGLLRAYSSGEGVIRDIVRFSAALYFFASFWLGGSLWIVQHKITLLTDRPTRPPEWLLQLFDASDSLWAVANWSAVGPALLLYGGLALLMFRVDRGLPKMAGYAFAFLAVSQLVSLVYVALRGFGASTTGRFDFAYLNDLFFTVCRVAANLLAAAALYTERFSLVRTHRSA